jgi:hypothetical protein
MATNLDFLLGSIIYNTTETLFGTIVPESFFTPYNSHVARCQKISLIHYMPSNHKHSMVIFLNFKH